MTLTTPILFLDSEKPLEPFVSQRGGNQSGVIKDTQNSKGFTKTNLLKKDKKKERNF